MKALTLLVCSLLFIGCGLTQEQADELYQVALDCNKREAVPIVIDGEKKMRPPKGACQVEWDEWGEADEALAKREMVRVARKGPKCPRGQVAYCDGWCMRELNPLEKQWSCVSEYMMKESMKRNMRF